MTNMVQNKDVYYVEQYIKCCQWEINKMNPINETARILRCNIENIDKILAEEHLDYKKGEELRRKRNAYCEILKDIVPTLSGVDY